MATTDDVIRFENLRHRSSVVGGKTEAIQAKAKPFVSRNAHGVLRHVNSREEVTEIAARLAIKTLATIQGK
jgi:hypothetical protein